jgi:acyl-homoserine-lactone acylase
MRVRLAARIGWSGLALVLLALVALMAWEPFAAIAPGPPPPPRAYAATIVRDEFGVPHIHGRGDPDVAFGVAWAHAEDDFASLQDVIAMTRGRYGAIAGEEGAKTDFALHLLDVRGTAARRYASLPADVRALLEAYATGLNLYAARHRGELKLARLFPVNGRDIAAGFALRQPFFFNLDRVIAPFAAGQPPRREHGPVLRGRAPDYAHGGGDMIALPAQTIERPARGAPSSAGPAASGSRDEALNGSNAFAIAPSRSTDGVTRLVSNAHQPWRGGVAWYELVIASDSGWRFAGATFAGAPFPLLGHNAALGWTNTVNRPDLADIYRLVLNAKRTRYRLDGRWLPLESRTVLLPVRYGPLVLPVIKRVWRTRHGPAIVNRRGGFAFRYAGMDSLRQIEQYYRLTKARSFAQWWQAMAMQAVPSTNFVYADRTGRIAFVYNARFPARPAASRGRRVDWRGIVPGDDSSLIWREAVAWSRVPKLVDPASGFLFNANNTPFLAAGPGSELSPAGFEPAMGIELDLTNRARRAARLLAATPRIGPMELTAIKYDTGYERAGYVAWMLGRIAALDLRDAPRLARAQALLGGWDMRADGHGRADALAVLVLNEAMRSSYGLKPAPDPRVQLAEAVSHLMRHFGRIDLPLGHLLRLRRGSTDLPLDGGPDALRAMTSWDVASDGRLLVRHGDSFVMFIEWPAGGSVRSRSIQPFGQAAGRPDSSHFTDQAPLFVAHRLKPVHFSEADIAAHAVRKYRVSNR